MQDRVPLYPGRVKMTPVAGQANTFDMVRADDPTQAGTPINKASLLKDATAALFGLTAAAVPDDVLAELGKYKQYWWRRRTPSKTQYVEKLTNVTAEDEDATISSRGTTVSVSKSISFDPNTGENVTMVNPESLSLESWDSVGTGIVQISKITDKAPCYLKVSPVTPLIYLPAGSTTTKWFGGNGTMQVRYNSSYTVYFGRSSDVPVIAKVVSTELANIPASEWQYVQSSTRSAYPDSGTQDGYEYEYLGVPFDNAVAAPDIETGSYVGTGTYGQANPNTLTFGFAPKLVIIGGRNNQNTYGSTIAIMDSAFFMAIAGKSSSLSPDSSSWEAVSITGNSMSWYTTENSDSYQFNVSGESYHYIAIG